MNIRGQHYLIFKDTANIDYNLSYFLENKPLPIVLFKMKFLGLLLNRPIFEVCSDKRINTM